MAAEGLTQDRWPAVGGVHAGETGVVYDEIGRIVLGEAALHGVALPLWERLRRAVDQLHLVIDLRAAPDGRTVRVVKVGPERGVWRAATIENPDAIRLAEYLRVHGFRAGEEEPGPTLRFGPPQTTLNPTGEDHAAELALSLPGRRAAGVGGESGFCRADQASAESAPAPSPLFAAARSS